MRATRDLRPFIDELYALVERALSRIPVIPAIPPFPPGFGVALTIVGSEFVAHVNNSIGVDAATTTGSATNPFKTIDYLYRRLAYLTSNAGGIPDMDEMLTAATPTLHVFLDTPLPGDNPVGILTNMWLPIGGTIIIDGSPSQTIVQSGTITAVAQASNYALATAQAEVLTLSQAAPAAGNLFVNTTAGCAGWIQRSGGACQVAGANNIEVNSCDGGQLLASVAAAATPLWPAVPSAITPVATNAYQVVQLGAFIWGADSTLAARGVIQGGTGNAAQVIVYRCGFTDAGAAQCTGFGAQIVFAECSHADSTGALLYGQSVSGINVKVTNAGIDLRGLDHYFLGGVVAAKIAIQSGNAIVDGGTTFDNATFSSTGTDGSGIGTVLFRAGALVGMQNLGGAYAAGPAASSYTGKIGFISNPVFHVQQLNNSQIGFGAFTYAQVFGALSTTFYIGNWPFSTAVFSTYNTVHERYDGCVFGEDPSQLGITYGATTQVTKDTVGIASIANVLTVDNNASVSAFVAAGYGVKVTATFELDAPGASSTTCTMQLWVDGAASTDTVRTITLGVAQKAPITINWTFKAADIGAGLHTFALALSATTANTVLPVNTAVVTADVVGIS